MQLVILTSNCCALENSRDHVYDSRHKVKHWPVQKQLTELSRYIIPVGSILHPNLEINTYIKILEMPYILIQ